LASGKRLRKAAAGRRWPAGAKGPVGAFALGGAERGPSGRARRGLAGDLPGPARSIQDEASVPPWGRWLGGMVEAGAANGRGGVLDL